MTFTLGSEEHGIEILKVQEIRRYDAVITNVNSTVVIVLDANKVLSVDELSMLGQVAGTLPAGQAEMAA